MIKIYQSSPTQIIFTYPSLVIDENIYSELSRVGLAREHIDRIDIDQVNKKFIAIRK